MAHTSLRDRIGIDAGRRVSAEEAIAWAGANGVKHLDIQTDIAPNALESFDADRVRTVRILIEKHGVHLALHTLSGVNVAKFSPFCRDAVDAYMKAYIDLSEQPGAAWIVVHGGAWPFHNCTCRPVFRMVRWSSIIIPASPAASGSTGTCRNRTAGGSTCPAGPVWASNSTRMPCVT